MTTRFYMIFRVLFNHAYKVSKCLSVVGRENKKNIGITEEERINNK